MLPTYPPPLARLALLVMVLVSSQPFATAAVPRLLTVQGRLQIGGEDFNGAGQFKFALVDGSTGAVLWSNSAFDPAAEEPQHPVVLTVTGGLYSVALGEEDLENMAPIEIGILDRDDLRLRLWFSEDGSTFHLLNPDQRLTAVAYALVAAQVTEGGVDTDQIADRAITGDKLASDLRYTGSFKAQDIQVVQFESDLLESSSGVIEILSARSARIGSGAPARTPLHVETDVPPGTRPENHVALFHNTTRAPNANGIAIKLGNSPAIPWADRSNNFISFYDPAERVVGRVEGYSLADLAEALRLISVETFLSTTLGFGFYDFDFAIKPTEDWFDPGALPVVDFTPGQLPTFGIDGGRLPKAGLDPGVFPTLNLTGYVAPKLTLNGAEEPSLSVSEGSPPSLSFNRGSLPNLSINFATASFSFSPGSRPTASLDPGEFPTVTLDPGRFPTVTLDPGKPPTISGNAGKLPTLTFDPGVFPEITYRKGVLPTLDVTPGRLPAVNDFPFSLEADFKLNLEAITNFIAQFQGDLGELKQAWKVFSDPVCAEIMRQALLVAGSGVTYESGSGDYAEWLPRQDPDEPIAFGDIVGVHGGRIAKNTADADQLLVVSYKPIVLGNTPPPDAREAHEMVAFMGQVPVKVDGVVRRGDFILASGNQDGRGRAVAPTNLQPGDLAECVGVAWDASSFEGTKLIRVAIGLRPRLLSTMLQAQHQQVETLQAELRCTRDALKETRRQLAELSVRVEDLTRAVASATPTPTLPSPAVELLMAENGAEQ